MRKSTILGLTACLCIMLAGPNLAEAGKVRIKDMPVTKTTDKASANLQSTTNVGRDVSKGQATGRRQYEPLKFRSR